MELHLLRLQTSYATCLPSVDDTVDRLALGLQRSSDDCLVIDFEYCCLLDCAEAAVVRNDGPPLEGS